MEASHCTSCDSISLTTLAHFLVSSNFCLSAIDTVDQSEQKKGEGLQHKEGKGLQYKEGRGFSTKKGRGFSTKKGEGLQHKEGEGLQYKRRGRGFSMTLSCTIVQTTPTQGTNTRGGVLANNYYSMLSVTTVTA